MKIQARLTAVGLALAWIPLGLAVWFLGESTEASFEASFDARRDAVEAAVRAQLDRAASQIDLALERMAKDPILVEGLLEPLERGVFHGDAEREREIVREAERLLTSPAVDTLRIVDLAEGGRVLAMGHRRGLEPPDVEAVRMAREHPGRPLLRHERVENFETGAADRVWTLQVVRPVGGRVALAGGRILDRTLLTELLAGPAGGTAVALDDAEGNRVAATFAGDVPEGDVEKTWRSLTNPGSTETVATLSVWVDRRELRLLVGRLWETAGWLAGGSGLLALVLGVLLARRIARPLERLAEAAGDVAAGARDRVVPEPGGADEVASLTRAFNRMTEDLAAGEERLRQAERVAAWQEIARRIAHEIKNPLFPIQTSIETLKKVWERKHPDFEEVFEESTATILEEVARMSRIVTEFRDFARLPAPAPEDVDLTALARGVVALHRDAAGAAGIEARGPEGLVASVDPDQIRQVLVNLVKNAIEALSGPGTRSRDGAGGRIVVETAREDGDVVLRVEDDGPGIPREVMDRLFTPYFTTKAQGTGLGLAVVHRIVTEHGGRVRVRSEPGLGTRFEVRLPAAPREPPAGRGRAVT